ncbi:MAG: PaaI family thioesterase [Actinomycetota bacterium]|nr:PaaI family thioesterase [Actinomycetota bacterium]
MDLEDLRTFLAHPRHDGWRVPGLEAVRVGDGHLVVRVEVEPGLLNYSGSLHGGAAATLVDVVGSLAIVAVDRDNRFGVSTDLNLTWLAPIPVGEWVEVDATVLKCGRTLAFVSVDLRRESDGVLGAQGRMTKKL